jgi:hypothetical protein
MSKPAQINQLLADRCETLARRHRRKSGDDVRWSAILTQALDIGLAHLERIESKKGKRNGRK